MADYTKTAWVDDDGSGAVGTLCSAARLSNLEQGVYDALQGSWLSGTYAARPAATAANKWFRYVALDVGVTYVNLDGAHWTRWSSDAALGAVQDFAGWGVALPPGWLKLDGSTVSRATYADLFATMKLDVTAPSGNPTSGNQIVVLVPSGFFFQLGMYFEGLGLPAGTTITGLGGLLTNPTRQTLTLSNSFSNIAVVAPSTYRVAPWQLGDGSTTFALPNAGDRVIVGAGSAGVVGAQTTRIEGGSGGEETHLLTGPESGIQAHSHGAQGHNFLIDGPGGVAFVSGANYNTIGNTSNAGPSNATNAHNNMPPFIVMPKMVKAF